MPSIAFTRHLEAVGPTDARLYDGATVGELLDRVAQDYPRLKSYVLDDQGRLRKHVCVFIDGTMAPRDAALSQPLGEGAEVYVFQALSGG